MDGVVLDAAGLLGLTLEVLKAISLIPAGWEDIEGDLSTDGVAVVIISLGIGESERNSTYVSP